MAAMGGGSSEGVEDMVPERAKGALVPLVSRALLKGSFAISRALLRHLVPHPVCAGLTVMPRIPGLAAGASGARVALLGVGLVGLGSADGWMYGLLEERGGNQEACLTVDSCVHVCVGAGYGCRRGLGG